MEVGMHTRKNQLGGTVQVQVREVPASEVKNAWHEYVELVSREREEIIVTRYGRPVMRLVPIEGEGGASSLFGHLAGTVTERGDILAPVDEIWAADG
jgi:prevent-host-death family protein